MSAAHRPGKPAMADRPQAGPPAPAGRRTPERTSRGSCGVRSPAEDALVHEGDPDERRSESDERQGAHDPLEVREVHDEDLEDREAEIRRGGEAQEAALTHDAEP